jgi:signal transduction histidine kinase/CheY-like chemotaxis protein
VDEEDRGVLNRALQGRQPWFGRMRIARRSGSPMTVETAVLPAVGRERQPVGIVAVQRDVTAEVQAANRLRQAQKMEAIGVLADGIAHDFNNLLTVIQGNCALLLGGSDAGDSFARDNIDEIQRACDRAAAMTRRLLAFSRHKGIQLETMDLNAVVRTTEKMLSRLIRENIDMNLLLEDRPVMVRADVVQIEQVVINLTVNARDAMPRGGRLTVRVGRRVIATRAAGSSLEEGEYAVLCVEDTGHGMDEATRRRIFEPFFTTKAEHEGTGLGLTTVQSIVKDHGGDVTVQSQVGLGTTFTVWLPLLPEHTPLPGIEETTVTLDTATEAVFATGGPPALPPAETGILVLDDEESVLRMIERGLTARGYKVFAARTDVELLVQWEEHRDQVALLITDIVMPGMSGIEVAARLRQDRPELKVLSISAYTDTVIMKLGAGGRSDTFFLQKPFTPDDLVHKVEQMLATP